MNDAEAGRGPPPPSETIVIQTLARAGLAGALSIALGAAGWTSLTAATAAPVVGIQGAAAPERGGRMPKRKRVKVPAARSLEYRLSWGLGAINADAAYRAGTTGQGVLVALIDTGTGFAGRDLIRNLAPASTDLVRRADGSTMGRHGTQVGGLLASGLDGRGTLGVAYGAKLLSIRADIEGSCASLCAVRGEDLGRAIDYALGQGARIIAVPLVGGKPLPSVEPALRRAAEAGAVIVAAAGNDGGAEPSWPARYAADPAFRQSIIVAGASDFDGRFAAWSNRAGSTHSRFVVAPGENVLTDCDRRYCHLVSGTSYSVAFAAGALALLMEQRPELSAREAATLLLERGTTMAGVGSGPHEAGRGRLDLKLTVVAPERAG